MKLKASIEITAGGPGSGCKGDNCGRPSSGDRRISKADRERLKGQPAPSRPKQTVGVPYVSKEGMKKLEPAYRQGIHENIDRFDPRRRYQPPEKPDANYLNDNHGQQPLRRMPSQQEIINKSTLQERDKVILLAPHKSINENPPFDTRTYVPGHEARFVRFDPERPNQPQTAKIMIGRNKEPDTIPLEHLQLLEKHPDNLEKVPVRAVNPDSVKQQYTTPDGTKITIVKPPGEDEQHVRQFWKYEHELKQRFEPGATDVKGIDNPNRRTTIYTALHPERHEGDDAKGCTVFVERFTNNTKVTITEVNTGDHGNRYDTAALQRTYNNRISAVTFLSKRYGINALPESGGTHLRPSRRRR